MTMTLEQFLNQIGIIPQPRPAQVKSYPVSTAWKPKPGETEPPF